MKFSDLKILVVDDSVQILEQVESMLREIGVENITTAEDAMQAMGELEKDSYDLILCDQVMPEISGIEFLKQVRTNDNLKHIPFIMLTSDGNRQTIVMLVSNKGNGFLVKPPSLDKLKTKIIEVMSS
jgi:two-component system chemotaxis response regulator CheY